QTPTLPQARSADPGLNRLRAAHHAAPSANHEPDSRQVILSRPVAAVEQRYLILQAALVQFKVIVIQPIWYRHVIAPAVTTDEHAALQYGSVVATLHVVTVCVWVGKFLAPRLREVLNEHASLNNRKLRKASVVEVQITFFAHPLLGLIQELQKPGEWIK